MTDPRGHDGLTAQDEGPICLIHPDADVRAWLEEHVEDPQWLRGSLVVEHHDFADLLRRLMQAGYQIGGEA